MANVLLISENKLKSFTNLNKNIDMELIRSEIKVTQDLHLQSILGTKFLDTLLSKVSSTGNTFTSQEKILVDEYISPFLIQKSYAEILPYMWSRSMNNGLVTKEGENFQSVDKETMAYLRGIQSQRADFYMTRLIDYLQIGKGQNQFPDYISYSSQDGMPPNKVQKYNGSIVLNHTNRYGYKLPISGIENYSERDHTGENEYENL